MRRRKAIVREIERECWRIGVNVSDWKAGIGVEIQYRASDQTVAFAESCSFDNEQFELAWRGTLAEAMERLASLPSVPAPIFSGGERFWRHFDPGEATKYYDKRNARAALEDRLNAELARVSVTRSADRDRVYIRSVVSEDLHHCTMREVDPNLSGVLWTDTWTGSLEDAEGRLATLPDGAGIAEFRRAFSRA